MAATPHRKCRPGAPRHRRETLLGTLSEALYCTCFTDPSQIGGRPNHSMLYFPPIFSHSTGYFCIPKNDQLLSVNIFIICKRQQNQTALGIQPFHGCVSALRDSGSERLLIQRCTDGRGLEQVSADSGSGSPTKPTLFPLERAHMLPIHHQMWCS